MSVKLAIAAVSSCAQRLFGHFRKFRQRSQQMIRKTVDCDLSLWIPDVLNYVFVAGLPGLVPVYQQWSLVSGYVLFSTRVLLSATPMPFVGAFCFPNRFQ